MDFAPYQDTSPETSRALSPPPPQRSSSRSPAPKSPPPNRPNPPPNRPSTDPFSSTLLPPPSHFSDEPRSNGALETGRANVNLFETSLPLRLDYEAMLAYLLLPPAGGVFLLVMERKSDYVRYVLSFPRDYSLWDGSGAPLTGSRFHAWQSSMLFASIFVRSPPPLLFSFDSDEGADGWARCFT